MTEFLIAVFVIMWVVSVINSIRKALAKAQVEAGGPDGVRAALANAVAQSEAAARTAAAQRAAQVLRGRLAAAESGTVRYVSTTPVVGRATVAPASYSSPLQNARSPLQNARSPLQNAGAPFQSTAPAADQPMSSLIPMEAPSMPSFDAPGLDVGSGLNAFGAPLAGSAPARSGAFAGRQFLPAEGATAGPAAIIAAAVIGPPVGLRVGPQIASDW